MSDYKLIDVNLDFARETLKEVQEWKSKMKNDLTTFKLMHRDDYTEDLYYVIDSIGKDENRVEKARIQQVVRESIEAAEKDVQSLVRQRLNELESIEDQIEPKEPLKPPVIKNKTAKPNVKINRQNEAKPWLPRVALLPPRGLALEQKLLKEKEANTSVLSDKKTVKLFKKPKTLSELMEVKEKSPKYTQIVQLGLPSMTKPQNASVQTSFNTQRVVTPTKHKIRTHNKENNHPCDNERAILISTPVQVDRLKDKSTKFGNVRKPTFITKVRPKQSNVGVVNILKDEYQPKQLSVQVLPSVSIECEKFRIPRTKKNIELLIEKDSNASSTSSIDENVSKEAKPKDKIKPKELVMSDKSDIATQTRSLYVNVSTSFDDKICENVSTPAPKLPMDTITVRQLLRDLIAALKEDENGQKGDGNGQNRIENGQNRIENGQKKVESDQKRSENGQKRDESGQKRDESGQKRDESGQKRDESGQKRDESGQKRDESGQKRIENGQKRNENGQKRDENGQKRVESDQIDSNRQLELNKPRTESKGVSTDSFERKSQFVSMEIETRSQGSSTIEKYSKTQEIQVQIEPLKEFKDATVMAKEEKEIKDVSILTTDFDKEWKEIGIQTTDEAKITSINVKMDDKSTGISTPIVSKHSEGSTATSRPIVSKHSEGSTGQSSPIVSKSSEGSASSRSSHEIPKDSISNREIGIQVQISSSGSSNLSTFNESSSSSVIVSSSTTATSSSSAISDEMISEGEVIFKRPFPLPIRRKIPLRKTSSELEITQEIVGEESSISEGEAHEIQDDNQVEIGEKSNFNVSDSGKLFNETPRVLESAQSIGEINLNENYSEIKDDVLENTESVDGDSGASSGEIEAIQ